MKIGIDIRSLLKPRRTGMGNTIYNVIAELAKIDAENTYYLYSRIKYFDKKRRLPRLPGKNFFHKVDKLKLPPQFTTGRTDIFHTQSFDLPRPSFGKFVMTVNDIIPKLHPEFFTKDVSETFEENIDKARLADKIISISETTKNDLVKYYNFNPENISVAHSGVDSDFRVLSLSGNEKAELKSRFRLRDNFILYVGTIEPRKNISGLIKALGILKEKYDAPHQLVITGMRGWMYEDILKEMDNSPYREYIVITDYITKPELIALYNLAAVSAYPSFYEGFGLPLLESFACGTPCVTSDAPALKEVGADAALFADPHDPSDIADKIYSAISDEPMRKLLIGKGIERAKSFSWENTARKMLEVFKEVGK